MVLRQILPLTTSVNSIATPRLDEPYVPYDFSTATVYDIYVAPFVSNWVIIIGAAVFFSVAQHASYYLLSYIFGDIFTKRRSVKEQRDDCLRVCAILNGIIAMVAASLCITNLYAHNFKIHNYLYQPVEYYTLSRGVIVGYFLWDVVVCIYYRWGVVWTVHAVSSFGGAYFLSFPFTELHASYFTGMFELSNIFFHAAAMLRSMKVATSLATYLEYVFVFLFLFVRVIGGTYVALLWGYDVTTLVRSGRQHSIVCLLFMGIAIIAVMFLQYLWFWEIIKVALGITKNPHEVGSSHDKDKDKGNSTIAGTVDDVIHDVDTIVEDIQNVARTASGQFGHVQETKKKK